MLLSKHFVYLFAILASAQAIRKGTFKEYKMTQVYKAYVYEEPCGRFMGEIDGIYINTNIGEIKNTPIDFYASSKQELLADMVKFLKGTKRTGFLRVVN